MADYPVVPENQYPVLDGPDQNWASNFVNGGYNSGNQGFQEFSPVIPVDSKATWFSKYWRPAIAWQYLVVCLYDFILAPNIVLFFYYVTGGEYTQWQPLTLMGGGLYHISMGAIIGVTAYGRTKEKLIGLNE